VVAVIEGAEELPAGLADAVIRVPETDPLIVPLLMVLPLQLLAYHVADLLGTDVDQPRNLAKSVTVE
jgi:glucosamine--fructose-6-phosphate aminotransferase (isomerizing)